MKVEELEDGYRLIFKQFNKEYTAYYKSNGDFLRFDGDEFSPYKVNLIKILTEYNQSHAYSSTANNIITKLIKISEECEQLKNENVQLKDEVNLKNIELDDMQTTVRKRIEENTEQTNKMTAGYVESINNVELMKVANNQDDIQAQLTKNAIIVYGKDFPNVYYSLSTNESAKITGGIDPIAIIMALPTLFKLGGVIISLVKEIGKNVVPLLLNLLPEVKKFIISVAGKVPILNNVVKNVSTFTGMSEDEFNEMANNNSFKQLVKLFSEITNTVKDGSVNILTALPGILDNVKNNSANNDTGEVNNIIDQFKTNFVKQSAGGINQSNEIIPMISYEFPDEFYNELCELLYDNLDEDINIDVSSVESFDESVSEIENELNKLFGGEDEIYNKRRRKTRKAFKKICKELEEYIGKCDDKLVDKANEIHENFVQFYKAFKQIPRKILDNITDDDISKLKVFNVELKKFINHISVHFSEILQPYGYELQQLISILDKSRQASDCFYRTVSRRIKKYEESNKKSNEEQNEEQNGEQNEEPNEEPNEEQNEESNDDLFTTYIQKPTQKSSSTTLKQDLRDLSELLETDPVEKLKDLQANLESISNNIDEGFTQCASEHTSMDAKELAEKKKRFDKIFITILSNISDCIKNYSLDKLNDFRDDFEAYSDYILKNLFGGLPNSFSPLEPIKNQFKEISNNFLAYASRYISEHKHEHDSQEHHMKGGKKHKFKMILKALCKLLKTRDMVARYMYPILEHSDYRNGKEDIANAISLIKIFEDHPKTSKDVDYIMSLLRKAIPSIDSTNIREALLSHDYSKIDFYPLLESKGRKLFTLLFNDDDKNNMLPLDAVPSIQVIDDLKNSVPNLYSELLKLHERCSLKLIQQQTVRDEYLKKVTSLSREGSSIYIFFIILFAIIIIVCISIAIVNTKRIAQNKYDQLSQVSN